MVQEGAATSFAALDGQQRQQAMARFAVLRPYLEEEVPLTRVAGEAGVPARTAERWLARYRQDGLVGLARLECAPGGGQIGRFELTPLAGLPEDGSHDEASFPQRRVQAAGC